MNNSPKFKTFAVSAAAAASTSKKNCQDCDVKILMEEIKGMEELQSQADFMNLHTFKSFKVKIEMEDVQY